MCIFACICPYTSTYNHYILIFHNFQKQFNLLLNFVHFVLSDAECQAGLVCGKNNCLPFHHLADATADCCTESSSVTYFAKRGELIIGCLFTCLVDLGYMIYTMQFYNDLTSDSQVLKCATVKLKSSTIIKQSNLRLGRGYGARVALLEVPSKMYTLHRHCILFKSKINLTAT